MRREARVVLASKRVRVPLIFVTGPVRSGKSRFAERLATESGLAVTYVATSSTAGDDREWRRRIAEHAARRPPQWRVLETARPASVALDVLLRDATAAQALLVDSLGTWLAHRMSERFASGGEPAAIDEAALDVEISIVVAAATHARACVIVVGEEVGWGLVPEYASGRVFRDVLGRAQQSLASAAEQKFLVVAGHAIDLGRARPV